MQVARQMAIGTHGLARYAKTWRLVFSLELKHKNSMLNGRNN